MTILECSTAGDKRFSAFCARLANGRTIEEVYQHAKRDTTGNPLPMRGKKAIGAIGHFQLGPYRLEASERHEFYYLLWYIYFLEHPQLLEEACSHEGFTDRFERGGSKVYRWQHPLMHQMTPGPEQGACQARAIAWACARRPLSPHCRTIADTLLKKHGKTL